MPCSFRGSGKVESKAFHHVEALFEPLLAVRCNRACVLGTSEVTYSAIYRNGYSASLAAMGPPPPGTVANASAAGLVDDLLTNGNKSSYQFTYTPTLLDTTGRYDGYTILANPLEVGVSGVNFYYEDETHLIRMNTTAQAGSTDSCVAE